MVTRREELRSGDGDAPAPLFELVNKKRAEIEALGLCQWGYRDMPWPVDPRAPTPVERKVDLSATDLQEEIAALHTRASILEQGRDDLLRARQTCCCPAVGYSEQCEVPGHAEAAAR